MIFSIAFITALRPTALVSLTADQFRKEQHDGETVIAFHGVMGRRDGSSKTARGGRNSVGMKPQHLLIWRTKAMDGTLCIYDDIIEYMRTR